MPKEKEDAKKLWNDFTDIFLSIIYPTFPYLEERDGINVISETDYVAITEYFRDNDFTQEMYELETMYDRITNICELETMKEKEYDSGTKTVSVEINLAQAARRDMKQCLGPLKLLIALGQKYQGKDIVGLSLDDKVIIYFLTFFRDFH